MELDASIIPFRDRGGDDKVQIDIYVVTGKHGFLTIPESYCKECNLFYKAAEETADEADVEVEINVKSYWTRFLYPLLKGGYHPPVMLLNSEIVAQGYDVPEKTQLAEKIRAASEE